MQNVSIVAPRLHDIARTADARRRGGQDKEDATMKSFTKWMIAAAAAAVAASSASAQSVKADVPFAFQTGTGTLQPGTYSIHADSNGVVYWRNLDTNHSAMTKAVSPQDADREWKDTPRVVFECADGRCALLTLYTADGNPALRFHGLKSKTGDTHIAMVPLTVVKR